MKKVTIVLFVMILFTSCATKSNVEPKQNPVDESPYETVVAQSDDAFDKSIVTILQEFDERLLVLEGYVDSLPPAFQYIMHWMSGMSEIIYKAHPELFEEEGAKSIEEVD